VADTMSAARAMWTMFEPVHDVTYFAPEALRAFTEAGLRGYWRGYFAGRAAPLGGARAAVVTASFYNFAPAFAARAVPGVWDLITPQEAIAVREAGAAASLRRLLGGREAEAAKAAGMLWRAAEDLDFAGRVLSAANAELPVSGDPLTRLWQAATLLREHRGDGHFAALAAAGIDGCEAVVLRCAKDISRDLMQPVRGWTDEQWGADRRGCDDDGGGPRRARRGGGRHRPGRCAALEPDRRRRPGRGRRRAPAARPGLRRRAP